MKRPSDKPFAFKAAPQIRGSLSQHARQYHHYQAIETVEFTRRDSARQYNWADHWEAQVIARSYHTAVIDAASGIEYSYLALDRLADTFAHWALRVQSCERIGVYRLNPIVLIAVVLGLAKVGKHAVIFHDQHTPQQVAALGKRVGVRMIIGETVSGIESHCGESIVAGAWPGPVAAIYRSDVTADDPAAILFTANQKPVLCSHRRAINTAISFAQRIGMTADDRCFLPLELSYAESLLIGFGTCFSQGATAVLADEFNLLRDPLDWLRQVRDHNCSTMQYSEQLWRYAVVAEDNAINNRNPLITVFGSGLDAELHQQVVSRFSVRRVVEYFWAIDMPDLPLFNWTLTPGAMAYVPPEHSDDEDIVIVDRKLQAVGNDKPGELLIRIRDKRFRRYVDSRSYKNTILTNLFEQGDRWWRSGDIVSRSAEGFYTYIKRAGEFYSWRYQPVCSVRMKQVLYDIGWFNEVVIYPVAVPHHEEPALMVSLYPSQTLYDLDLEELLMFMQAMLPEHAIPAFLRITSQPHPKSGNFRIPTAELAEKSFFFVEESEHFVLEEGQYKHINLKKLREFDENLVRIGMEPLHPELEIPTLFEAV